MSGYGFVNGQGGVLVRFPLKDSSTTIANNIGKTSLLPSSTGLNIATAGDNEATATAYSGVNIQAVAALGTWATPPAGKCSFGEFDAANFPGWYEMQFLNARFAITAAKYLGICLKAVVGLNLAQYDIVIPLTVIDMYNPRSVNQTQMSGAAAVSTLGQRPTMEQAVIDIRQALYEMNWSGANATIKDVDHATTLHTLLANASTGATSITQNG